MLLPFSAARREAPRAAASHRPGVRTLAAVRGRARGSAAPRRASELAIDLSLSPVSGRRARRFRGRSSGLRLKWGRFLAALAPPRPLSAPLVCFPSLFHLFSFFPRSYRLQPLLPGAVRTVGPDMWSSHWLVARLCRCRITGLGHLDSNSYDFQSQFEIICRNS